MRFTKRSVATDDVVDPARSPMFLRRPRTPFTSLGVECLDMDEDTQLAFQKVRLARQLNKLPAPSKNRRTLPRLSRQAKDNVRDSVQHLYQVAADAP